VSKVVTGRFSADMDGDFVVFLIGMRVNKPWQLRKWLPIFGAMPKMVRYLSEHPEKGLLGFRTYLLPSPMVVQYWRSFDDLDRFARDSDDPHLENWRRYLREIGKSGDVGIWHETFMVPAGQYEAIYSNMPVSGLAAASGHVPLAAKGQSAAFRIGASAIDEVAVEPVDG
jgi:hypothetical protein